MKKLVVVAMLILGAVGVGLAQQDTLQEVSPQYPVKAHIVAVEMETDVTTTGGSGGNYNLWGSTMHVPDTRRTVSYQWHLMKTVVGDKMYGLSVSGGRHTHWLEIGYYAVKPVNGGFEVQYHDDKGKVRKEVLTILSEEPVPTDLNTKQ